MLREIVWPNSGVYRSGAEKEAVDFYIDAFQQSNKLDLLLGYFSTTAIKLLSVGIASFIAKGGSMRIVINHVLTQKDKDLISGDVYSAKQIDLTDVSKLASALSSYDLHFYECLAYLIRAGRIEFTVIAPSDGAGIAHYKSGCFYDDSGDSVYFKGSCNFSFNALINNLEEIDVTRSWINDGLVKVQSQIEYFESILDEKLDVVKTIDSSKIEVAIQEQFGNKEISDLLESEIRLQEDLINEYATITPSRRQEKAIKKIQENSKVILSTPRFPYPSGPFPYQSEAYENWLKNGYQGMFAMATGTGKTVTSLNCLLNEWRKSGVYRALILVPTIALVNQWKEECNDFNFGNITTVSSKSKWEDDLKDILMLSGFSDNSFIVISTYASFVSKRFKQLRDMFPEDMLLIADEAHNVGASQILKEFKKLKFPKRIGLSATPERLYDDESNSEINKIFNDSYPYIVSFTMEEALKRGSLCSYKYFPVLIELTESEYSRYFDISLQIARIFAAENGDVKENEMLKKLLMIRSSIINKAANKLPAFRKIISDLYSQYGTLNYMLVYAPEGSLPEELQEVFKDDVEDLKIIDEYTKAVRDVAPDVYVSQYTSNSKNRPSMLEQYSSGAINVLISMKCLDEGVDVPRSEFAIFCSSTGNPRQFIQRRGRVLRKHPNKTMATIYDLVVVPYIHEYVNDEEFILFNNVNRRLLKKELKRVYDFSSLAINSTYTEDVLQKHLDYFELKLYDDEHE